MTSQAQINGGKIGAAITNYKKREKVKQAERRTAETPVPTVCKCPTCHQLHTVLLAQATVGNGMPRLYCPQHEHNRTISETCAYRTVT